LKNYDLQLSYAKDAASGALMDLGRTHTDANATHRMGQALDELNKAWDELTEALIRQRNERDRQITRLMNELAEAKQ